MARLLSFAFLFLALVVLALGHQRDDDPTTTTSRPYVQLNEPEREYRVSLSGINGTNCNNGSSNSYSYELICQKELSPSDSNGILYEYPINLLRASYNFADNNVVDISIDQRDLEKKAFTPDAPRG